MTFYDTLRHSMTFYDYEWLWMTIIIYATENVSLNCRETSWRISLERMKRFMAKDGSNQSRHPRALKAPRLSTNKWVKKPTAWTSFVDRPKLNKNYCSLRGKGLNGFTCDFSMDRALVSDMSFGPYFGVRWCDTSSTLTACVLLISRLNLDWTPILGWLRAPKQQTHNMLSFWNPKKKHNRRMVSTAKVNVHRLLGRLSYKEDKSLADWFARHLPQQSPKRGRWDHQRIAPFGHPGGHGNKGAKYLAPFESKKKCHSKEPYFCATQYISISLNIFHPKCWIKRWIPFNHAAGHWLPPNICRYPWRAPSPAYEGQGRCRDGHSLEQLVHCKEFPMQKWKR